MGIIHNKFKKNILIILLFVKVIFMNNNSYAEKLVKLNVFTYPNNNHYVNYSFINMIRFYIGKYNYAIFSIIIILFIIIILLVIERQKLLKEKKVYIENEYLHVKNDFIHDGNKTASNKISLESEKLKIEHFSNLSHELKTPLNLILGTIQLMEIKKYIKIFEENKISNKNPIKIIKQNCYRLLRLVNNIIDVTRIDTDSYKLRFKNIDIVSVVEDITMSVAQYIEGKNIKLIFDTDIEEKILACDPYKIERIMLNLLSNAIKFTDSEGNIYVNIYDKEDDLHISVKDTGIGIPKNRLNDIFKRFKQVEDDIDRNQQGSGIGLSLVNSLVEMHGGTLSVDSECGKGSEFIIKLPVKILNNENTEENKNLIHNHVERISIEFSDIYS